MRTAFLIFFLYLTIVPKVNLDPAVLFAFKDTFEATYLEDIFVENVTTSLRSHHGIQHSASVLEEKAFSSKEVLAFAPNWTKHSQFVEIAANLSNVGYPSFQGHQLFAPWKCLLCKQLREHSATECPTCRIPWQSAMDRSYVHKGRQQGQGTYQQPAAPAQQFARPWQQQPNTAGWYPGWTQADGQSSKSPRSTPRSNSRRGKSPRPSHQEVQQQPMVPMMPQMMPMFPQMASHPQAHVPPMQQMMPMSPSPMAMAAAPLAPLPPPAMAPPVTSVPQSSMPGMPAMPTMPAMPAPAATSSATMTPEEMQELLQTLKGRQSELPSDIQQQVQKVSTKTRARLTKEHHSAVTLHAKAKEELENAILARTQLLSNWRAFIGDAVRLWQNYATNFMEQEKNLQSRIAAAKDGVIAAKDELARANRENDIKVQEISDEEIDMETSTGAAKRVTDTMQGLATSLQNLEKEAEALVESEHVAKRPRKDSPKMADPGEDSPSGAAG
eukprot:s425_g7.t1